MFKWIFYKCAMVNLVINFRESGMCRIRGCPQIGKSLKRLDNHLSRYHKGVTRAMNDRQPLNLTRSNKPHVTCLLPHCGKDVLHLSHHLRNKHSNMSVNRYNSVVSQLQNSREKRKRAELLQEEENKKICRGECRGRETGEN